LFFSLGSDIYRWFLFATFLWMAWSQNHKYYASGARLMVTKYKYTRQLAWKGWGWVVCDCWRISSALLLFPAEPSAAVACWRRFLIDVCRCMTAVRSTELHTTIISIRNSLKEIHYTPQYTRKISFRFRLGVLETWVLVSRCLGTEIWKSWSWRSLVRLGLDLRLVCGC